MLTRIVTVAVFVAAFAMVAPQIAPPLLAHLVAPGTETYAPPPPEVMADMGEEAPMEARARPRPGRVVLEAGPNGHFVADARIGGRPASLMVDTGATFVALTADTARQLAIAPNARDFRYVVSTANGDVHAARVTLPSVRVGAIRLNNVEALVIDGDGPVVNLLGMSFLGRLANVEFAGDRLVLTQ